MKIKPINSPETTQSYAIRYITFQRINPEVFEEVHSTQIEFEPVGELNIQELTDLSISIAADNKDILNQSKVDSRIQNYKLKQVILLSSVTDNKY